MARNTRRNTAGAPPADAPEPNGAGQTVGTATDTTGRGRAKKPAATRAAGRRSQAPAPDEPSLAAVEEQLRQVSQELAEARRLLESVPREVGEFRAQLREMGR